MRESEREVGGYSRDREVGVQERVRQRQKMSHWFSQKCVSSE